VSKHSGFTLFEVIIVVAVIGVTAAISIPAYLNWVPDIRLKSAVRNLKSDLGLAKQRAIRENGRVAVVFEPASNRYTLFVDNGAGAAGGGVANNWIPDGLEPVLKTVVIPQKVTMYSASFASGDPRVRFDGRGLPNGSGGQVRMRNTKGKYWGIDMSLVGLMQVQVSTDGGATWANQYQNQHGQRQGN